MRTLVAIGLFLASAGVSFAEGPAQAVCDTGLTAFTGAAGEDRPFDAAQGVQVADGWCSSPTLRSDWVENDWPQSVALRDLRWRGTALSQTEGPVWIEVEFRDLRLRLRKGAGMTDLAMGGFLSDRGADLVAKASYDPEQQLVEISPLVLTLPGNNTASIWASVSGIDPASKGSLQSSLASGLVHGGSVVLMMKPGFDRAVLRPLIQDPAQFDKDISATRILIATLPDSLIGPDDRAAINAVLDDLPNLRGRLSFEMKSQKGFGMSRLIAIALRGVPETPAEWAPVLGDVVVDVNYDRNGN